MKPQTSLAEAEEILSNWMKNQPDVAVAQKAALDRYGRYFHPTNLSEITEEGFKDFLLVKNNRHWSGLHRHPSIYANMERLRTALAVLLNEDSSVQSRLDKITNKSGPLYIRGLGRAVLTPILMCVFPDKYAVYNRISEEGLSRLGRNRAKPSESFGKRYVAINDACHEIAAEIGQPLYLVDSMLSLMVHGFDSPLMSQGTYEGEVDELISENDALPPAVADASFVFPLEKYLEEFLVSNWEKTLLGKTLVLHTEDEESATQYATDLGPIDILARDKSNHDWVVIELKKGKHSDAVVGQLLRYMGWVKKHKAASGESVRGIIITNLPDDRIKYAMLMSQNVSFYTYKVSFDLVEVDPA